MKLKILMIDDHPSMIEGYKIILSYNDFGYEVETTSATDTKSAYEIITNPGYYISYGSIYFDSNFKITQNNSIYDFNGVQKN